METRPASHSHTEEYNRFLIEIIQNNATNPLNVADQRFWTTWFEGLSETMQTDTRHLLLRHAYNAPLIKHIKHWDKWLGEPTSETYDQRFIDMLNGSCRSLKRYLQNQEVISWSGIEYIDETSTAGSKATTFTRICAIFRSTLQTYYSYMRT